LVPIASVFNVAASTIPIAAGAAALSFGCYERARSCSDSRTDGCPSGAPSGGPADDGARCAAEQGTSEHILSGGLSGGQGHSEGQQRCARDHSTHNFLLVQWAISSQIREVFQIQAVVLEQRCAVSYEAAARELRPVLVPLMNPLFTDMAL
jgi:hypothetical protein